MPRRHRIRQYGLDPLRTPRALDPRGAHQPGGLVAADHDPRAAGSPPEFANPIDTIVDVAAGSDEVEAKLGRGVSATAFGAASDTAALQAAFAAAKGTVFLPPHPAGSRWIVNAPIDIPQNGTARSIIGLGNGMVEIEYTGAGYLFQAVSENPALTTKAPIDLHFENIRIDGYGNTTSDGGINVDGGYFVNFDRVEVRRFAKVGAVGVRLHNSFSIEFARSNVLSITNGIGLQVGGSLQQVTNVHLHEFVLQRSGVNLDITTGITGGGLQVDNGAIRANDAQIAVRMSGKYADMRFGPALHIESETTPAGNTTKGFVFSGASLYASAIKFEGIDFYNIKTLFDLDGSAGTLRDVEINHIVATALAGLAGTAFKLNAVTPGFRLGRYQISTAEYTTLFSATATDLAETFSVTPAEMVAVVGTPTLSSLNRWPAWLLDPAASELLGWVAKPPRDWNAFAIDVLYANAGAGSGDAVLRADVGFRGVGESLTNPTSGSAVTVTVGAQNVMASVTLAANVPVTSGKEMNVVIARVGGDVADTLGNDLGVVGLRLRRVG